MLILWAYNMKAPFGAFFYSAFYDLYVDNVNILNQSCGDDQPGFQIDFL